MLDTEWDVEAERLTPIHRVCGGQGLCASFKIEETWDTPLLMARHFIMPSAAWDSSVLQGVGNIRVAFQVVYLIENRVGVGVGGKDIICQHDSFRDGFVPKGVALINCFA